MYRILRSNKRSMVRSRLLQLEMHVHDIEEVGKEGIDEFHALVRSSHTSVCVMHGFAYVIRRMAA